MEVDSGADSVSSTPRSKLGVEDKSVVRLMCSFGGKILPRPHDNQLRYVGGDTRIVAVSRNTTYSTLLSKLSKLLGNSVDFTVKYQLPNEDLDALITVSSDEDIENMMEEFERLTFQHTSNNNGSSDNRVARLRLFLFPNVSGIGEGGNTPRSRTSNIASLLDGSRKRENWFLDALNGGSGGPSLERKMSEASSIVSEVPDYLFGLDNSDETATKLRSRVGLGDVVTGSDPGSPAFGSASSASQLPNLPPVKTKLENPNPNLTSNSVDIDQQPQQPSGFLSGQVWGPSSNPGSPYPVHNPGVQSFPVYYVQAGPGQQGLVQQRNSHLQPVQIPVQVPLHGQFLQQFGQGPIQFPVGYPGSGPMYGPGEVQMQGNMGQVQGPSGLGTGQPVYYGVKNVGFPGMVLPVAGEEVVGYGPSGSDAPKVLGP